MIRYSKFAAGATIASALKLLLFCSVIHAESPGADSVVSFVPGEGAGFGTDYLPGIVLGLPRGAGELEGSLDVVSLGSGGEITLYFEDNIIVDGPGCDFTIFENPFFISGDSMNRYIETAIVEVSGADGVYHRFPFDVVPDMEPPGNPARYAGLAGIEPVFSFDGDPDPVDPEVSGGDHFDLSAVGIPNASYVRIIDTGHDTRDDDGDLIVDSGLDLPDQAGFDLDAMCHVNWTARASPFRVESARATSQDRVLVQFSKTLDSEQDIPPDYFAFDGVSLSSGDTLRMVSETALEILLGVPLDEGAPAPRLTVRQWIRSASHENLLDDYGAQIELPSGLASGREGRNELDRGGPSEPYPNPFCSRTTIEFELSDEVPVRVAVYDLRGRRVKVLADSSFPPGSYELSWNGKDSGERACPSGIYIIHSLLGTTSHRKKVNYIR